MGLLFSGQVFELLLLHFHLLQELIGSGLSQAALKVFYGFAVLVKAWLLVLGLRLQKLGAD